MWLIRNSEYTKFDLIESQYFGMRLKETELFRSRNKTDSNDELESEIKLSKAIEEVINRK